MVAIIESSFLWRYVLFIVICNTIQYTSASRNLDDLYLKIFPFQYWWGGAGREEERRSCDNKTWNTNVDFKQKYLTAGISQSR